MIEHLIEKVQTGVFYARESFPINSEAIDYLLEQIDSDKLNMGRICLHASHESLLMSMVVAVRNNFVYPAHMHEWKDESYTIIRGSCKFQTYNPDGSVNSTFFLDEGSTFLNLFRNYHTIVPISDPLVFLECTTGPYTGQTNRLLG